MESNIEAEQLQEEDGYYPESFLPWNPPPKRPSPIGNTYDYIQEYEDETGFYPTSFMPMDFSQPASKNDTNYEKGVRHLYGKADRFISAFKNDDERNNTTNEITIESPQKLTPDSARERTPNSSPVQLNETTTEVQEKYPLSPSLLQMTYPKRKRDNKTNVQKKLKM